MSSVKLLCRKIVNNQVVHLRVQNIEQFDGIEISFHSSRISYHYKVKRTLMTVHQPYHWLRMVVGVTKFCNEHEVYMVKRSQPHEASLQFSDSGRGDFQA